MKNFMEYNNANMVENMKNGEVYSGFYFNIGKFEFFVKTDYKRKTKTLASKILRKINLPENPSTIKEIQYYLVPANCEVKFCKGKHDGPLQWNDKYYFSIYGKNFSGYGSDDISDGKTIVFEI